MIDNNDCSKKLTGQQPYEGTSSGIRRRKRPKGSPVVTGTQADETQPLMGDKNGRDQHDIKTGEAVGVVSSLARDAASSVAGSVLGGAKKAFGIFRREPSPKGSLLHADASTPLLNAMDIEEEGRQTDEDVPQSDMGKEAVGVKRSLISGVIRGLENTTLGAASAVLGTLRGDSTSREDNSEAIDRNREVKTALLDDVDEMAEQASKHLQARDDAQTNIPAQAPPMPGAAFFAPSKMPSPEEDAALLERNLSDEEIQAIKKRDEVRNIEGKVKAFVIYEGKKRDIEDIVRRAEEHDIPLTDEHFKAFKAMNHRQIAETQRTFWGNGECGRFAMKHIQRWSKLNPAQMTKTNNAFKNNPECVKFINNNPDIWMDMNKNDMFYTQQAFRNSPIYAAYISENPTFLAEVEDKPTTAQVFDRDRPRAFITKHLDLWNKMDHKQKIKTLNALDNPDLADWPMENPKKWAKMSENEMKDQMTILALKRKKRFPKDCSKDTDKLVHNYNYDLRHEKSDVVKEFAVDYPKLWMKMDYMERHYTREALVMPIAKEHVLDEPKAWHKADNKLKNDIIDQIKSMSQDMRDIIETNGDEQGISTLAADEKNEALVNFRQKHNIFWMAMGDAKRHQTAHALREYPELAKEISKDLNEWINKPPITMFKKVQEEAPKPSIAMTSPIFTPTPSSARVDTAHKDSEESKAEENPQDVLKETLRWYKKDNSEINQLLCQMVEENYTNLLKEKDKSTYIYHAKSTLEKALSDPIGKEFATDSTDFKDDNGETKKINWLSLSTRERQTLVEDIKNISTEMRDIIEGRSFPSSLHDYTGEELRNIKSFENFFSENKRLWDGMNSAQRYQTVRALSQCEETLGKEIMKNPEGWCACSPILMSIQVNKPEKLYF